MRRCSYCSTSYVLWVKVLLLRCFVCNFIAGIFSLICKAALSNRGNDDAQQPSGKRPTEGAILPTQSRSNDPAVGTYLVKRDHEESTADGRLLNQQRVTIAAAALWRCCSWTTFHDTYCRPTTSGPREAEEKR
ncbi:hypothetical protein J3F83DRAFT_142010 [Trichoderma novae-zelandiae]